MQPAELLEIIEKGEDSRTQFKKDITNAVQLAQEMAAFSNSSNENVKPPITPFSEIVKVEDKNFQESGKIYADETIVKGSSIIDIDKELFYSFYEKQYGESIEATGIPLDKILENLNLAKNSRLNQAGLLIFGRNPQKYRPEFLIKAVSFFGNDLGGTQYRDSEDIDGNLLKQYRNAMAFLLRNLRKIQKGKDFNVPGVLEVSEIALQEILVNALIHRDYFINATIRILIFDNRIEIDSPGKLPNNMTIENIKHGISCMRNRILASFASKMLPYRGLGTGIGRALRDDPAIEFINDAKAERFKVIIHRPE
ncbi:MAG: ATP-binding protein [Candidatus Methanoperedens sp.]